MFLEGWFLRRGSVVLLAMQDGGGVVCLKIKVRRTVQECGPVHSFRFMSQ